MRTSAPILAHGHGGPAAGVTLLRMSEARPRTVITFGTFDVFHVGHLRVIERAAALGDRLVVGVSADALNLRKKGREPVFSEAERLAIVGALKPVDEVFVEESLELKREYILKYAADVLVMGCAGMARFREPLERELGIPIVEPTQAAVTMALGRVRLGWGGRPLRGS